MRAALVAALGLALGCGGRAEVTEQGTPQPPPHPADAAPALEPEPWSEAWLAREGQRFVNDTPYRRAALEQSLTNHRNMYSHHRLSRYALGDAGWDMLPVWNPKSAQVDAAMATTLAKGDMPDAPAKRLWDGVVPTTMAGWVELGRRVFFEYPLRAEVYMEWGLTKPDVAAAVGVERARDGAIPGLVVFGNVDGETRVGITCAMCHSRVVDGATVAGSARRSFDYGRLRLAYFADTEMYVAPDQAARMKTWGPGRADVTEDDDEDPVAIPDLYGLRSMRWLTSAGTIRHDSPLALAIRQETQLIDANHQKIRPPRELAWALAMYIYSLAPPPRAAPAQTAEVKRGATLFADGCKRCHTNATHGGATVAVAAIGTDPGLATGRGRGTGHYRVPPLVRLADGAPFLHDASIASLAELLSPDRLAQGYAKGRLGPGPIRGHTAGTDLPAADRAALIAYLETL